MFFYYCFYLRRLLHVTAGRDVYLFVVQFFRLVPHKDTAMLCCLVWKPNIYIYISQCYIMIINIFIMSINAIITSVPLTWLWFPYGLHNCTCGSMFLLLNGIYRGWWLCCFCECRCSVLIVYFIFKVRRVRAIKWKIHYF